MASSRVHVRVSGLVQGVCFRASTVERAGQLGVSGWVSNCADGTVELEAEGPPERVEELVAWCRRGPPGARVVDVVVDGREPTGADRGFRIRR